MNDRSDTREPNVRHSLVCRDALDGRLTIEDQVYRDEKLTETSLVATVRPSDADAVLKTCQARLDAGNAATRPS